MDAHMDVQWGRGGGVVPDSTFLGRCATRQWGAEFRGLNLDSGRSAQPRAAGAQARGHAGWAVFVNPLETSAYSPSRHLCRSLTWPPKPQDTLTDRLTHKHSCESRSSRLGPSGAGRRGGGRG